MDRCSANRDHPTNPFAPSTCFRPFKRLSGNTRGCPVHGIRRAIRLIDGRNRVALTREVRRALDVRAGDYIVFQVEGRAVLLHKVRMDCIR